MSVSNEQGVPQSRSPQERAVRIVVGAAGLFVLAVGLHKVWVLPDRVSMLKWTFGPVVIHDGFVAPIMCLLGWAASRRLPPWTRPSILAATLVSATLILVSLSVVSGQGATPANPSLDPRNYRAGLLVALAVVWSVAAVSLLLTARRRRGVPRATVR